MKRKKSFWLLLGVFLGLIVICAKLIEPIIELFVEETSVRTIGLIIVCLLYNLFYRLYDEILDFFNRDPKNCWADNDSNRDNHDGSDSDGGGD